MCKCWLLMKGLGNSAVCIVLRHLDKVVFGSLLPFVLLSNLDGFALNNSRLLGRPRFPLFSSKVVFRHASHRCQSPTPNATQVMEGRKRKRSPHHTACWECNRLHRSCDGGRPCQRCVTNGKDDTCQSVPKKPFARKRRTGEQWMKEQLLTLSIFHESPKINPPAIPTAPSFSTPTSTTPKPEEEKQDLLQELLRQVQQVHEMTQSLQRKQEILSQQLLSLQSASQSLPNKPDDHSESGSESSDVLPEASSSPSSPSDLSSPINTPPSDCIIDSPSDCHSPIQSLDLARPSSDSPSSSNTQELLDLMDLSHLPQWNLSITIPNDTERFKESLFIPFAIKDATAVQTKFPPTSFKI